MTPKSLLRHPKVTSSLDEFTHGAFHPILGDTTVTPADVKQVILCSGKVYYNLDAKRQELGRADVAILRLEQLYPLATATLDAALAPFDAKAPIVWAQEEPENQGAWRYFLHSFGHQFAARGLTFAGRPASPSPATGSANSHKHEQEQLLSAAFAPITLR